MGTIVRALWSYRGFILGSVMREFQSRYRNSVLGAAWLLLNPLAMITVYTVIFSEVMRARLPGVDSAFAYSIYLCAGILTWGLFSDITGRAQNVFTENATLLKKLSFPRLCLPVIVTANALLNFGIIFGLFTAFLVLTGNFPGLPYLALLPVLGVMVAFGLGLGIVLGVLNVFFRDVGYAFGIFLQFWFWLTPIVYSPSILPERLQPLIHLNPMAAVILSCQAILVKGEWPDWSSMLPIAVLAAVLCTFGLHLFRRRAGEIVDEL